MTGKIRVLVADRASAYRQGIRLVLQQHKVHHDLLEADSFNQVHRIIRAATDINLIVLDMALPQLQSQTQLRRLSRKYRIPILLLSMTTMDQADRKRFSSICRGMLPKNSTLGEVAKALLTVSKGGYWWPQQDQHYLKLTDTPVTPINSDELNGVLTCMSEREKGIIKHLREGLKNKQIAASMCLNEATLKADLSALYRKFEVRNRTLLSIKLAQLPLG
mgnify:CR=1 FL=1